MFRRLAILLLLVLLCAAAPAFAKTDGFAVWKQGFATKLRKQGFDQPAVDLFLASAYYVSKPIAAQKRQPEKITRFADYRRLLLTDTRIAEGQTLLRDYRQFYTETGERYAVEPQLLVARGYDERRLDRFRTGEGRDPGAVRPLAAGRFSPRGHGDEDLHRPRR